MIFAACDLGGTNTRAALIDENGRIHSQVTQSTALSSADDLIASVARVIIGIATEKGPGIGGLDGIAIAVAGTVNVSAGTVVTSPNLPLADTAFQDSLSSALGRPVMIENDALAAALGETRFGAARGARDVMMLTIGTGIGGGIVINGRPYRGAGGGAGEIGHMMIEPAGPLCACGRQGCLEALAAGPAIAAQARAAVKKNQNTVMLEMAGGDVSAITAETVSRAAVAGDDLAQEIWRAAGEIIGIAAANVANLLNPSVIILGGGVMTGDKIILETVRRVVRAATLAPNRDVSIVAAALGGNAGLLGAMSLYLK